MYVLLVDIGCEKLGHEAKFQGQEVMQDSVLDHPLLSDEA